MSKNEISDIQAKRIFESIQELVVKTVSFMNTNGFAIGTIKSIAPLEVRLDAKRVLTDRSVGFLRHTMADFPINAYAGDRKVNGVASSELRVGEEVLMARVNDGNYYIILGGVMRL